MPRVTAATTLDELQAIVRAARPVDPIISPQMVRGIQQSLRMEGYVVTGASIRAAARRVLQAEGHPRPA
jgi:hypothetical protein